MGFTISDGVLKKYTEEDGVYEVVVPEGVTMIRDCAFKDCRNIESITIPYGVNEIGMGSFHLCESLKSITIPDSVTSIGDTAFYGCTNLKSIIIPDSVTELGSNCFMFCRSLQKVRLPSNLKSIPAASFVCCTSLEDVICASDIENEKLSDTSSDEDRWNETFALANHSLVLPEGAEEIEDIAFFGCSGLKRIHIPETIQRVGKLSFYQSSRLEELVIEGSADKLRSFFEDDNLIIIMKMFGNASIADQILGSYIQSNTDIKSYLSLKEKEVSGKNNTQHLERLNHFVLSEQEIKISRRFLKTAGYFIKRKLFYYIADFECLKNAANTLSADEKFDDMVNVFISAGLTDEALYLIENTNHVTQEKMDVFINHAMEDQPELAGTLIEIRQRLFGNSSLADLLDI